MMIVKSNNTCQRWLVTLFVVAWLGVVGVVLPVVQAQPRLAFIDPPVAAWNYSGVNDIVENNNGIFTSPDGEMAVILSRNCQIRAVEPETGKEVWAQLFALSFCYGGVYFAPDYFAFSATDRNNATSQIVGRQYANGRSRFISPSFDGVAVGTPAATEDGKYIMTTANTNSGTAGTFVIFDVESLDVPVLQDNSFTEPLSAIGYYHSPIQGYFEGGYENTNDVFVFGYDNELTDSSVGIGRMFAFQFPMATATNQNPSVTLLGEALNKTDRSFQSSLPPVLANGGLNMYWAVTRNHQRAWIGTKDRKRTSFDISPKRAAFESGNPRSAYPKAPPTLSDNDMEPNVYGPLATNAIFRTNHDFTDTIGFTDNGTKPVYRTRPTDGIVCSRIVVSPDDRRIYYGTPAPDSKLTSVDSDDLFRNWNVPVGTSGVYGDLARSKYGNFIMAVDRDGVVYGFKVADFADGPPSTPTAMPSSVPSSLASMAPTAVSSDIPSLSPSSDPTTGIPTETMASDEPSLTPTLPPSAQASDHPSTAPSSIGSALPSDHPSMVPSSMGNNQPSDHPSMVPSSMGSNQPSDHPSMVPSSAPSVVDSEPLPTGSPVTEAPTGVDSEPPSPVPTGSPVTEAPTPTPTSAPTPEPTPAPTPAPMGVSGLSTDREISGAVASYYRWLFSASLVILPLFLVLS